MCFKSYTNKKKRGVILHQHAKSFQTSYGTHLKVTEHSLFTGEGLISTKKMLLLLSGTCNSSYDSFYHADEVFHYCFSVRLNLERHDIFVMWLRTAMIEVTVPALSLKIFVGTTALTRGVATGGAGGQMPPQ